MIIRLHVFPRDLFSQSIAKNLKFAVKFNSKTLKSLKLRAALPVTTDAGLLFHEKLVYLQTIQVNPTKALEKNPDFRSTPLSSLKLVEKCLFSMGIERSAFGRIFDMHPELLTSDPYTHLYPVFDFLLNDIGLSFPEIRNAIVRCPRLLNCSVDQQLRPALRFLRELGFVGANAITSQTTVLLVSNVELTLLPKLKYFMSLGFEYNDVAMMVVRSPALLTYSIKNNFKPKVEYFVNEMNGDLAELKKFPQYFSYSLEVKIKKRHRLLAEYGFSLPLSDMLKVSDGEFCARLIEMRLRKRDYHY